MVQKLQLVKNNGQSCGLDTCQIQTYHISNHFSVQGLLPAGELCSCLYLQLRQERQNAISNTVFIIIIIIIIINIMSFSLLLRSGSQQLLRGVFLTVFVNRESVLSSLRLFLRLMGLSGLGRKQNADSRSLLPSEKTADFAVSEFAVVSRRVTHLLPLLHRFSSNKQKKQSLKYLIKLFI